MSVRVLAVPGRQRRAVAGSHPSFGGQRRGTGLEGSSDGDGPLRERPELRPVEADQLPATVALGPHITPRRSVSWRCSSAWNTVPEAFSHSWIGAAVCA